MVFKSKTVRERLKYLDEVLEKLKGLQTVSEGEFLTNYEKYWSAEHGLHLAAEAIFDIGNHILVGRFGENPKGYNDIIPLMAQKGVLTPELAARFDKVGGFRNILVHEYMRIDRSKVYERLQAGLDDFREFARQVLQWLETT